MAEDEIRKHTKAIYDTVTHSGKSWRHKLKDILVEILIIIFAVSVSIWLHNWSDLQKEKREEKEFLIGLKSDLNGDIKNLSSSESFYESDLQGANYFLKVSTGFPLNKDSVLKYEPLFLGSTYLEPYISRYEGLKGSGKFDIIEEKDLLNSIINIHQRTFVHVQILNDLYNNLVLNKVQPFISSTLQFDSSFTIVNLEPLLRTSQIKFYLLSMRSIINNDLLPVHKNAIN